MFLQVAAYGLLLLSVFSSSLIINKLTHTHTNIFSNKNHLINHKCQNKARFFNVIFSETCIFSNKIQFNLILL